MRLARVVLSFAIGLSGGMAAAQDEVVDPVRAPAAEQIPPTGNPQDTSLGAVQAAVSSARESREDRTQTKYTLMASYSYFDTWVPSKFGVAAAWNPAPSDTYELQYDRGTVGFDYFHVSIGRVSDDRWTLLWRRFGGFNSFNFQVGVHHSSYRVKIGNNLMKTVTGRNSSADLLEITTLGPTFGLGNRWQTKSGFVWSFDWLVVHIPVWTLRTRAPFLDATTSEANRKDVDDVLKLLRNVPTGSLVKAQLGFAF